MVLLWLMLSWDISKDRGRVASQSTRRAAWRFMGSLVSLTLERRYVLRANVRTRRKSRQLGARLTRTADWFHQHSCF